MKIMRWVSLRTNRSSKRFGVVSLKRFGVDNRITYIGEVHLCVFNGYIHFFRTLQARSFVARVSWRRSYDLRGEWGGGKWASLSSAPFWAKPPALSVLAGYSCRWGKSSLKLSRYWHWYSWTGKSFLGKFNSLSRFSLRTAMLNVEEKV